MANTAANALVGMPLVTGGLSIAFDPIALAEYPDDATTTITGTESAGYIGEDGVVESDGRETEQIKAWGGDTVRRVQTDHTITYQFTFLESKNATVLKARYGAENVTITPAVAGTSGEKIVVKKNSKVLPRISLDFNMLDGGHRIRNFVPLGQIVETGDVTFVHSGLIQYEVTVEAFADVNGDKAIQIIDGPIPAV